MHYYFLKMLNINIKKLKYLNWIVSKNVELPMCFSWRLLLFDIIWPVYEVTVYISKMNCRGVELRLYNQSVSFISWLNSSGYKAFTFKIQKFSWIFKSFLVYSLVIGFLICSVKVNSESWSKLWSESLKCFKSSLTFLDILKFAYSTLE